MVGGVGGVLGRAADGGFADAAREMVVSICGDGGVACGVPDFDQAVLGVPDKDAGNAD